MNETQLITYFERISEAPDAIPRLRRFILDLAVRGKLVEQDPDDESVPQQLSLNDNVRNAVAQSDRRVESHRLTLLAGKERWPGPSSWEWSALADLVLFIDYRGQTPTKVERGVRLITAKNVKQGFIDRSPEEFLSEEEYHRWMTRGLPQEGDVLFTTEAPMGNAAVVRLPEHFALAQRIICLRPFGAIAPEFLALQLLSGPFQSILNKTATGLTAKGIKAAKLKRLPVAVPPLAEQHRIVTRVYELMALSDRLEAAQAERERSRNRLTAASLHTLNNSRDARAFRTNARFCLTNLSRLAVRSEQIKQIRQTIFNLAIRGMLAPQDPKDEGSVRLLCHRALDLDAQSAPRKLPGGWSWSSFALIGETLGGGTPSKAVPDFWTGAIPWVSPKDMKIDLIEDARDHISEAAIEQSAARLIPTGALLMVVRGMILAHSFPTAITAVPVTINQDMKAIIPFTAELIAFLLLVTKGLKPEVLRLVQHSTHGTCKLLTEDLFSLPIPIPPIAEQRRIVAKVKELMQVCDKLETQLDVTKTEAGRLLESVLHHALQTVGDSATAPIPELAQCG
jgi:type I restriction enzyme S subunit